MEKCVLRRWHRYTWAPFFRLSTDTCIWVLEFSTPPPPLADRSLTAKRMDVEESKVAAWVYWQCTQHCCLQLPHKQVAACSDGFNKLLHEVMVQHAIGFMLCCCSLIGWGTWAHTNTITSNSYRKCWMSVCNLVSGKYPLWYVDKSLMFSRFKVMVYTTFTTRHARAEQRNSRVQKRCTDS